MKLLILIVLLSTSLSAGTDWSEKLASYRPLKFQIQKDGLKSIDQTKTFLKKAIAEHYKQLDRDYKTKLSVNYSPFGNKWQLSRMDGEVAQLSTLDQLISPELETKINTIIANEYKDFYESEFIQANHKVFDHEQEIYQLKKEIIYLNQQIDLMRLKEKEVEAPVEQEPQTSILLVIGLLIGAAVISVLVKRAKFI